MQQPQPVGLKYGNLFKCSSKLKMWSTVWFVLGPQDLKYYKKGVETPKVIDLTQQVSIVSADVEDSKRPHSFKVSSPSFPRTLIVAGETSEMADEWIAAIRAVAALYAPPPEDSKGPAKLTLNQKDMLKCTSEICVLTGKLIPEAHKCTAPGVYAKVVLDSMSAAAIQVALTSRVVVFKPKIQSGMARFTTSMTDLQTQIVQYKRALASAQRRGGNDKGKGTNSTEAVNTALELLINAMSNTITKWLPDILNPDLTAKEMERGDDPTDELDVELVEYAKEASPYISPFLVDAANPTLPPKKQWDVVSEECTNLVTDMEKLVTAKEPNHLKLPTPPSLEQAKQFLVISRQFHEGPAQNPPDEAVKSVLSDDQFLLVKQQLLGSTSAIDYHATNIGLIINPDAPPQLAEIIAQSHGISSAISRLPRAIRKHRGRDLISIVETIGSFSHSLSKLVTQLVEHEKFQRNPARIKHTLPNETHAVRYIAVHILGLSTALLANEFSVVADILHFTDTAKLLALSVTNVLESIRCLLVVPKRKRDSPPRKLASELTDAATGSMVFWFGLVGQNATVVLEP